MTTRDWVSCTENGQNGGIHSGHVRAICTTLRQGTHCRPLPRVQVPHFPTLGRVGTLHRRHFNPSFG